MEREQCVKAIFEASSVAYGQKETRSFLRLNLIAFVFTFGSILCGIFLSIAFSVLPIPSVNLHLTDEHSSLGGIHMEMMWGQGIEDGPI